MYRVAMMSDGALAKHVSQLCFKISSLCDVNDANLSGRWAGTCLKLYSDLSEMFIRFETFD